MFLWRGYFQRESKDGSATPSPVEDADHCRGRSTIRPGQGAEGKNRSDCWQESKEANREADPRRKRLPRPYLEGAPVCLARPDKEVQVRIQIGETLDFTEDDGGRRV